MVIKIIRGKRVNRILFHFILDKEDEQELRQLGRLHCNMYEAVHAGVCGSALGSV